MHNIMMELDGQTKLKVASYVYCAALMQMSLTSPVFSVHTPFQFTLIGDGVGCNMLSSIPDKNGAYRNRLKSKTGCLTCK